MHFLMTDDTRSIINCDGGVEVLSYWIMVMRRLMGDWQIHDVTHPIDISRHFYHLDYKKVGLNTSANLSKLPSLVK